MSPLRGRQGMLSPSLFCLAIGLVLAIAPAAARGQVQAVELQVVDANDTVVGPILDYEGPTAPVAVALVIDGHSTVLDFGTGSFDVVAEAPGLDGVFFASTNCTGQGFASNHGPDEFLEPQAIAGPQRTFYAGPRSASVPGPLAYDSVLRGANSCSTQSGVLQNALPVDPVRDLAPLWQPPFSLVPVPLLGGASSVPAISPLGLGGLAAVLAGLSVVLLRRRRAAS